MIYPCKATKGANLLLNGGFLRLPVLNLARFHFMALVKE